MTDLASKKCVPCEGGTPPLPLGQVDVLIKSVKGWTALGNQQIDQNFKFKNFTQAMEFINDVAQVAEVENHHPDIFLHNWNQVIITLSTHAIGGLSENDFILAAKIDQLL